MNIVILGAGRQGMAAGILLKKHNHDVAFAELSTKGIEYARSNGFECISADLALADNITDVIADFDIAVCALPARMGTLAHKAAIAAKRNLVDVSYSEDNPLDLDKKAKDAGITILPDCGIAPGLSNMLTGRIYAALDKPPYLGVFVGGIPEQYFPPIGYSVTWSPADLIDEYIRPARIIENGKIVTVDALSGIEDFDFPGREGLECFFTDGLRTLLHTLPGVNSMIEKTVRYKGHAQAMKLLSEMGFFNDRCGDISPRDVTQCILSGIKTDMKDILIMRIEGRTPNRYVSYDIYDIAHGEFSAMERCTGFSLAAFTMLLAEGHIDAKGIIPPEILGMDEGNTVFVMDILKKEQISISLNNE